MQTNENRYHCGTGSRQAPHMVLLSIVYLQRLMDVIPEKVKKLR